jgi:hypothetical protein
MVKMRPIALLAPLGLAFAVAVDANPAKAVLYYNIYESLGSLNMETSGSLNLPSTTGSQILCAPSTHGLCIPVSRQVCTGATSSVLVYPLSSVPSLLPAAAFSGFTSSSGMTTFVRGFRLQFAIASSCVSGTPIVSRSTASGIT